MHKKLTSVSTAACYRKRKASVSVIDQVHSMQPRWYWSTNGFQVWAHDVSWLPGIVPECL